MAAQMPQEQEDSLRAYVAILWAHKFLIVAVAVICTGAVLLFSMRREPEYESQALVLVREPNLAPTQSAPPPPDMETERQLAGSLAVARVAERIDGSARPRALSDNLTVEWEPQSRILTFSYRARDAGVARTRAQLFAEAYLQYREEQVLDDLLAARQSSENALIDLNRELARVRRKINETVEGPELASLEAQSSALIGQITFVQQQASALVTPDQLNVGDIVEPASAASSATNHGRDGVIGLGIGLLLAVGAAFVRESLDDRPRTRSEIEEYLGAPILASVPRARKRRGELVARVNPASPAAEACHTLRAGLQFAAARAEAKTILVASPNPGEGRTFTVGNLGLALARSGRKVALISADLRQPRLHRLFGLENGRGLSDVLTGSADLVDAIASPGSSEPDILTSGPVSSNPSELLSSPRMADVVEALRKTHDFVLIDVPPALSFADTMTMGQVADGVLVVINGKRTTLSGLLQMRELLDQMGVPVLGVSLNISDRSKAKARSRPRNRSAARQPPQASWPHLSRSARHRHSRRRPATEEWSRDEESPQ